MLLAAETASLADGTGETVTVRGHAVGKKDDDLAAAVLLGFLNHFLAFLEAKVAVGNALDRKRVNAVPKGLYIAGQRDFQPLHHRYT